MSRSIATVISVVVAALGMAVSPAGATGQGCELEGTDATREAERLIDRASEAAGESSKHRLFQQALGRVQAALTENENDAAAYWLEARAQVGLGNLAAADSLFDRFVGLKPGCVNLASAARQNAWVDAYNEGVRAYQAGRDREALGLFEAANRMRHDARALSNAALLYQQFGHVDRAVERYREVLEVGGAPEQMGTARINLGSLLSQQGEPEAALRILGRLYRENPRDVDGALTFAEVLTETGKYDSARAVTSNLYEAYDRDLPEDQADRYTEVMRDIERASRRDTTQGKEPPTAENPAQGQAASPHEVYSGAGDDIVRLSKPDPDLPALLLVRGNQSAHHFAIIGHTSNRERTGVLVNTTEPYQGVVPVDLPPRQATSLLEVSATGSWEIQVYPIGAAERLDVPGSASGEGDNVLWVDGNPTTAEIQGNQGASHFAVLAYDNRGQQLKVLVNTTDPYDGTILLPQGTTLLEVTAQGAWEITAK